MLIDTHTHLYLEDFAEDGNGEGAVRRALDAGVRKMVFPNVDLTTIEPMKSLARKFPEAVSMAMGLHPTEVRDSWRDDTEAALTELTSLEDGKPMYKALGEVGIDLYWDKTYEREQMLSLEMQMSKALELDLPVIIHCREGQAQVLEVLQGFPGLRAVFHSFGGTPKDVDDIRRVGDFFFGINGIVTFKNSKVREALPEITLDRLLLETDSPYLAPVPHRGKRNESAYITHTAEHIAAYLDVPIKEIENRTTVNAEIFFAI
ncbi:MAG: TatD family hydrolase [Muribaculaceae bacterium]|nr:TatD family hydrolase [Muribaculaceae bacterium]